MSDEGWFICCAHCECPASQRIGHDDTCAEGCNDHEMREADA